MPIIRTPTLPLPPSVPPANTYPQLVGDIGGTNARFALIRAPGGTPEAIAAYPCARFPGLDAAIGHYLDQTGGPRPRWGALGIANPVDGDAVRMTNHDWAFSIAQLREALDFDHLRVVNDFAALAMALPALPPSNLQQIGGGKPEPGRAIGLVGAGTGLGVSGLIPCGTDHAVIEGEGGHVTLAASNAEEAALLALLARTHPHVSAERVVSGPGLISLYQALGALRGEHSDAITATEISHLGLNGTSALCRAALEHFCAFLGTVAADLALTLGARGGIYIGGGIVPQLGGFFAQSPFRARFERKGRFSAYLAAIPTYVINAPYPALTGAARILARDLAAGR